MPETRKPKRLANQCLLLKTPDQRCFFTDEKNFPLLVEFGRTFNAEISVIKTKDQIEILELDDLAKSICVEDRSQYPDYEILETKLTQSAKKSEKKLIKIERSKEINSYINSKLLSGQIVSMIDLEQKFPSTTKTYLSNHFTRCRRELVAKGFYLKKQKPGCWYIASKV